MWKPFPGQPRGGFSKQYWIKSKVLGSSESALQANYLSKIMFQKSTSNRGGKRLETDSGSDFVYELP